MERQLGAPVKTFGVWFVYEDGRFERREVEGEFPHDRVERMNVPETWRLGEVWWRRSDGPWRSDLIPDEVYGVRSGIQVTSVERVFYLREYRVPKPPHERGGWCSYCVRRVRGAKIEPCCPRCGGPLPWWLYFERRLLFVERSVFFGLEPEHVRLRA